MPMFIRGDRLFSRPSRGRWALDASHPEAMSEAMGYAKSRTGIPVIREIEAGSDAFDASRKELERTQKGRSPQHTSARGVPQGRLSPAEMQKAKIAWRPTMDMNIQSGKGMFGKAMDAIERAYGVNNDFQDFYSRNQGTRLGDLGGQYKKWKRSAVGMLGRLLPASAAFYSSDLNEGEDEYFDLLYRGEPTEDRDLLYRPYQDTSRIEKLEAMRREEMLNRLRQRF